VNHKIEITNSLSELSFDKVKKLPRQLISSSWEGKPLPWNYQTSIAQDKNYIWLLAATETPHGPLPTHVPENSYFEGLWNFDVIEFFFALNNLTYVEYHLAPKGRWWSYTFAAPRQRSIGFKAPNVKIYSEDFSKGGWLSILKIPTNSFMADLSTEDPALANITATFRGQETPYSSLALLPGDKPNFHQPEKFIRLENTTLKLKTD
jgi:hypothetical protein